MSLPGLMPPCCLRIQVPIGMTKGCAGMSRSPERTKDVVGGLQGSASAEPVDEARAEAAEQQCRRGGNDAIVIAPGPVLQGGCRFVISPPLIHPPTA